MYFLKSSAVTAIAVISIGCTGAPTSAPAPVVRGARTGSTTAAITANDLELRLTAFAHDSMMGRESGTYWNEKATEYVQQQLFHLNLRPAGEHGEYFQTVPNIRSSDTSAIRGVARNVIAYVRGSDPVLRDEYVAITAHNDHIGYTHTPVDHDSLRAFNAIIRPLGADSPPHVPTESEGKQIKTILDSLRRLNPPRLDSVFNGADDDGSGTVALLELAEAFAKNPVRPKRSILFVSHTAEERGLLGSMWYTDHSTVPMDSIVAEFDVDMIGRGAATDIKGGGPAYLEVVGLRRLSNEFGDWVEAVNRKQPTPFSFNYEYDAPGHPDQYYCRADHYSYARYGVPSVSLSRGEHRDYHQLTDESQYIDYVDFARLTQMVYDAVVFVANADHRPRLDAPKPTNPHVPCKQ